MKKLLAILLTLGTLAPMTTFAIEGMGPRATVTGTIASMVVTEEQEFQEFGGEMTVTAENGQTVTVILQKDTKIIAEGRTSRKEILPLNLMKGMAVRVRGGRIGTDAMSASLIILQNIELNPGFSSSGILTSIDQSSVSVQTQNGTVSTYTITGETEVFINYALRGMEGLTLIGKEVYLTLNPQNTMLLRSLRISGNKEEARLKPTTLQLGRRK
jgi:hypothetical protein